VTPSPKPTDPLNLVLDRRPAPFVPVAPVYEGLGPLEFQRMSLRRRKWQDILDRAGTDRLPVDYDTHLALELSIHTDIIETCYPPPGWLALPTNATPSEIAGAEVLRRGPDLYWASPDGRETWLAPNRIAYHARQAAERSLHFADLWERGHRADGLEDLDRREEAASTPHEPDGAEIDTDLASGRYDLARALLDQYPGQLPFYVYDSSPYNSLLGLLGFQGMMAALIEEPERAHRILAAKLPRPSTHLAVARELGVHIVFVEECLASADLISPAMYREFVFPYTKQELAFYEAGGFRTVLYFSGNLMPLLNDLEQLPFTALAFEEDRKNYGIDLAQVRRAMGPDRVLFGNVDAPFIEHASDEDLLAEVRRQIDTAGPDRFVLSAGSPFTPDTSLERVRLFCRSTRLL
jgi:hypothetical protein